jgi:ubiquinone/menaquinone biosynthesis C-methylase UbiE
MKNDDHLQELKKAYDQTVDDFRAGVDSMDKVPEAFRKSEAVQQVLNSAEGGGSSADPAYKAFLNPQPGMKFLDVGSCANLFNYALDKWPSEYYGIDISPKLIEAMQNVAKDRNISIGGLFVADVAAMPFEDAFFDIAAVIGVLEYFDLEYITRALKELHRVLKPGAKMVVDMPNLPHPASEVMIQLEKYQGRTYAEHIPTQEEFIKVLEPLFTINKLDDSRGMTAYFVTRK